MTRLTPEQEAAVAHESRRLQILACAGSGKTEVLARRVVRLLREGTPPESIIGFTFTQKAAGELKARIELRAAEADPRFRELPPVARGMFVGTTHGWALQALRELGGIYETMDPATEEQEWALVHRVARRLGIVDLYARHEGKPSERVATAPALEVFLRSAEVVHDSLIDRAELAERAPEFARVLERYEELLREMRLIPFRLMIAYAVRELAPGGRLRERLAGRVAHVLVDEFQDFNPAQDRLLAALADLGAAVTVVGDDDQAIYQWRGGDVGLFVSFVERFPESAAVALRSNHRCRPEIVEFARPLVSCVPRRLDKVLVSAREPAPAGAVEVLVAQTPEDEAGAIAGRIARLVAEGHAPRHIAVLYRSVRTSARPLVLALRERGIPSLVVGKTSLLAHPEMALVARIFAYWAGGTWYPNPDFTPEVVTRESLLAELELVTGKHGDAAGAILERVEGLGRDVRDEGVSDSVQLFNALLVALGLPEGGGDVSRTELGLGKLSELLTEFDHAVRRAAPSSLYQTRTAGETDEAAEDAVLAPAAAAGARRLGSTRGTVYLMRMRAFLEEFAGRAAEETPDRLPEAADAVQIMTVHQAKGLEFPIVVVPSLVEGRFPSRLMGSPQIWYVPDALFDRPRYEGRDEDEARLLYVALTRARELLVVSWFRRYRDKNARPSRFVTRGLRAGLEGARPAGEAAPAPAAGSAPPELIDLDFSSLVTYSECGYRYWLRHVCGFQPPLVPELGFGTLLHHVVAELARAGASGRAPREADVDPVLEESFYLPFAGPVPARKLKEAARRRLRAYVRAHGAELARAIRPEARFEVPLGRARLRGRIDLLLRAEGAARPTQVELIDFKTSANRPPSEVHVNQLRLYAAAVERQGLEPVRLAIHNLDTDVDPSDRTYVEMDERSVRGFTERLEGWVDGIRSARFPPKAEAAVCRTCDFRRICRHAPSEVRGA